MPEFYVEGHTAEGAPYGPVWVLTVPLEGSAEEMWEEAEQVGEESARQGAWRDAVMSAARRERGKYEGEDIE